MSPKVAELDSLPPGLHFWFDSDAVDVRAKTADELAVMFCREPKAWRFIHPHRADVPIFVHICGEVNPWGTQPLQWVEELLKLLEALRDRQARLTGVQ